MENIYIVTDCNEWYCKSKFYKTTGKINVNCQIYDSTKKYDTTNNYIFLIIKNNNLDKIFHTDELKYINIGNNKKMFYEFVTNIGLNNYIPTIIDKPIKYPVIAKPSIGLSGKDVVLITHENDLKLYSKRVSNPIFQKYIISSYLYTLHILAKDGEIKKDITYKLKLQTKGQIYCGRVRDYEKILNNKIKDFHVFEQIIKQLNYSGFACFNFTYEEETNCLKIFEMNPRIGGSLVNDVNDFELFIECIIKNNIYSKIKID